MSKEPLINPSFRRMPESIALNSLAPGIRRDDAKRIDQKFPENFGDLCLLRGEEYADIRHCGLRLATL
jgi:hypothetical protein